MPLQKKPSKPSSKTSGYDTDSNASVRSKASQLWETFKRQEGWAVEQSSSLSLWYSNFDAELKTPHKELPVPAVFSTLLHDSSSYSTTIHPSDSVSDSMEKVNPKVTQQQKRKREQESKEVKEKSKGKQGKYEGKKKVFAEKSPEKSAKENREDSAEETGKEMGDQDKEEVEEEVEEEEEEEDSDAFHAPAIVQLEDVGLDDNRTALWSYSNMKLDLSQYELENFDECIRTIDVDSVRFLGKPHDLHLLKNVSGRSGDRL